jgi:hypothetical protein
MVLRPPVERKVPTQDERGEKPRAAEVEHASTSWFRNSPGCAVNGLERPRRDAVNGVLDFAEDSDGRC